MVKYLWTIYKLLSLPNWIERSSILLLCHPFLNINLIIRFFGFVMEPQKFLRNYMRFKVSQTGFQLQLFQIFGIPPMIGAYLFLIKHYIRVESKSFVDSIKIIRWDFAFDCADFLILVLIWLNFLYIAGIACSEVVQIALLYQDIRVALICQFWSFTTAVQNLQLANSGNVTYRSA